MDELKKYFQNNRAQIDTDLPGEELWKGVKETLHPTTKIPVFARWMAAACLVLATGTGIYFLTHPAESQLAEVSPKTDSILTVAGRSVSRAAITKTIAEVSQEKKSMIAAINSIAKKATADVRETPIDPVVIVAYVPKKQPVQARRKRQQSPPKTAKLLYGFEGIEASYAAMLDIQLERVRTQPIYAEDPEYFYLFKKQFADLAKDEEQLKRQLKQGYQENLLDELVMIYQRKITVLKQLQFEINKMNSKVKQTDAGIQLQQPSYINL